MQNLNPRKDKTRKLMASREPLVHYCHYRGWPTLGVVGRDQLGHQGYRQPQTDNRRPRMRHLLVHDARDEVQILILKQTRRGETSRAHE